MNVSQRRFSRLSIPRSRGAVSGLLLIILGAWGALIPFIGPYFDWAYTPSQAWAWTTARGWLEVVPGVVTVLGGLLLLVSANRFTAILGGWLAVLAGGWFIVGRTFASNFRISDLGQPVASTNTKMALLEVTYFSGLGALIVLLSGAVLALLSVRTARDVVARPAPAAGTPTDAMAMPLDVPAQDAPTTRPARAGLFHRRRQSRPGRAGLFHRRHAGVRR